MTQPIRPAWLGRTALAALLAASLTALPARAQQATLGPGLADSLAVLPADATVEVVVAFEGERITDAQIAVLEDVGVDDGVALQELPMALVVATPAQVERLAATPGVRSIWPNEPMTLYNDRATLVTGVDRVRTSNALRVRNGGMPVTGDGIGIFINDSGIDATHPDLQLGRNVVQNVHYVPREAPGIQPPVYAEDVPDTDSNSGHGTHVAGTAGGTGAASGTKFEGVAPGADLVGCTGGSAIIVIFDTLSCYDYMLAHQAEYGIRVMNNSWGPLNGGRHNPDSPTAIANKRAYDRSIVVVFAAGNDGPGDNTLNPYAEDPFTLGVAAGIVDGRLASFSSRGIPGHELAAPDITAPGEDIVSARATTGESTAGTDPNRLTVAEMTYYTVASGTSMAAPHAAGIVALMLEANPLLSVDEVEEVLKQTATNMPGYRRHEVGSGYVNAFAAVQAAFDRTAPFGSTLVAAQDFNTAEACTLSDVPGHPLASSMVTAVSTHALDGFADGTFRPDEVITRATLTRALVLAMETRQFLPLDGSHTFTDVSEGLRPFAEAVAARGAAMRDMEQEDGGVLHTSGATFDPGGTVTRADVAFSMIQALGLEDEAQARASGSGSVGLPTYTETLRDTILIGTLGLQTAEGVDYVDIPFTARPSATSVVGTLEVGETAPDLDLLLLDAQGNVLDRSETETSDEQVSASLDGGETYVYRVVGWLNAPAPVEIVSEQTVTDAGDANGSVEASIIDLDEAPQHTRGHILLAIERGLMDLFPAEVVRNEDGSFTAVPGPRFEPGREVTRARFAKHYSRWREDFFAAVGRTIVDPEGDHDGTAAHDIVSAIFEYDEAAGQVVYTLELADLSVRLPNDYWNMEHSFGNTVVFVSAQVTETGAEEYGWGTIVTDPTTGINNQTGRGAPDSGRVEGDRIIIRLDLADIESAIGRGVLGTTSTGTSANSFELIGTSVTGGLLLFTDRASGLDFRIGGC